METIVQATMVPIRWLIENYFVGQHASDALIWLFLGWFVICIFPLWFGVTKVLKARCQTLALLGLIIAAMIPLVLTLGAFMRVMDSYSQCIDVNTQTDYGPAAVQYCRSRLVGSTEWNGWEQFVRR